VEPVPQSSGPAEQEPAAATDTGSPGGAPGSLGLADVRRLWPDIVEATKLRRRVTWIHLTQHAQVVGVDGTTLTLGFGNAGARESFINGGSPEIVRQAAIDVVGADWRVEAIVDPGAQPGGGASRPQPTPTESPVSPATAPESPASPATPPESPAPTEPPSEPSQARSAEAAPARPARTSEGPQHEAPESPPTAAADPDSDVHPDDPDLESSGLAGAALLQEALGAEIIQQIEHD